MYLKINHLDLENSTINIQKTQKDYDFYQKDDIIIFIYGYPYGNSKWVKSEDIHKLYNNEQLNFINALEGVYSIIILDKKRDKYYVITDRYGIYTLFYFKNEKFIILSDEINTIINFMDKIKLNENRIIEHLTFGYVSRMGNETYIKRINEFRGARIYVINDDLTFAEKVYWKYPSDSGNGNKDNFLKIFNSHILDGFKLENNKILTLTGGIDTRTILSSVVNKFDDLNCFTYGSKNCGDIKGAKRITKKFGIKHNILELDKNYIKNLPKRINDNINIFNGLIPVPFQMHWKYFCEKYEKDNEMLIIGIMGDEIWRVHHCKTIGIKNASNIDDITNFILNNNVIKKNKVLDLFKFFDETRVRYLLKNSIKKELNCYEDSFNPNLITDFFFLRYFAYNWASNLIKFFGKHFKIFLGLISKEILEILSYIDVDDRVSGSLQKYIISNNNQELAKIPYSHNRWNEYNSIKSTIKKIIHKTKDLINRGTHRFFNFYLFKYFPDLPHYYNIWLPKYHKKFILDVLDYDKMITKNLFKREELQKTIKLFLKGDYSVNVFIITLISLELYLKNINKKIMN